MYSTKIALVMLLVVTVRGAAQEQPVMTTRQQAAAELVDLLRLEDAARASIEAMAESMASQTPAFAEFGDVFAKFLTEFMSWDDLRPEYIRLYADAYTEDELHELIAFYETPVGRKTVELTPKLVKSGAEIGQRLIQPHLPELQRRIRARIGGGSSWERP
ncbi:MAG: DUF2059 domain-containing protein [Gemmatimonadota bacterium]|jgi:hypothetical protein